MVDSINKSVTAYTRAKRNNDYAPFKRVRQTAHTYDLELEKDGITANIINNTIVSFTGTADGAVADQMVQKLKYFGFKLHE